MSSIILGILATSISVFVAGSLLTVLLVKRKTMEKNGKIVLGVFSGITTVIAIVMAFSMIGFRTYSIIAESAAPVLAKPSAEKNTITPVELTQEQQDIIEMLSLPSHEIALFDFNTEETYNYLDIWVEVYQDGVLIDRPAWLIQYNSLIDEENGRFSIIISEEDSKYHFNVSVKVTGNVGSYEGDIELSDAYKFSRAYGPAVEPVKIADGGEIILYRSVFSGKDSITFYDTDEYQERPELLEQYDYAFLIKCKFSC